MKRLQIENLKFQINKLTSYSLCAIVKFELYVITVPRMVLTIGYSPKSSAKEPNLVCLEPAIGTMTVFRSVTRRESPKPCSGSFGKKKTDQLKQGSR